jgi:hypothetical protein
VAGGSEGLPWVADFAVGEGARLLQLHPLELIGRAASNLEDRRPHAAALARSYLLALALAAAYRTKLAVQFDGLLRSHVLTHPELVYADESPRPRVPADLVGTLVVETDGTVVPAAWGFSHRYAVASLHGERLSSGWQRWVSTRHTLFRGLCKEVFDLVAADPSATVINWHERLVLHSHRSQLIGTSL